MPKAVEVQTLDPGVGAGPVPQPVEVVPTRSRTLDSDEGPTVGTGFGVPLQVLADVRDDRCRNGDDAVVRLRHGAADAFGAMVEVDVPTVQADLFAPAQAEEAGHEHEGPAEALRQGGLVTRPGPPLRGCRNEH